MKILRHETNLQLPRCRVSGLIFVGLVKEGLLNLHVTLILTAGSGITTLSVAGNAAINIPAGSTLTVTVASSSLAQNPANLLYLDLPMPQSARATIGIRGLTMPVLKQRVSR